MGHKIIPVRIDVPNNPLPKWNWDARTEYVYPSNIVLGGPSLTTTTTTLGGNLLAHTLWIRRGE